MRGNLKTTIKQPWSVSQAGFTIVELIVAIAVAAIITPALVGAINSFTQQYTIGLARDSMTNNVRTALNLIADDVRRANGAVASEATIDPDAPVGTSHWESGPTTLVLTQFPRNNSGNLLYTPPNGTPDSIVYYLNGTTLYRRIISSGYSGDTLSTVTCSSPPASGGCPNADTPILYNVVSVGLTYLTNTGVSTTDPTSAALVKVALTASLARLGQTLTVSDSATTAFRILVGSGGTTTPPTPPVTPPATTAPLAGGPGGVSLVNHASVTGTATTSIYVQGKMSLSGYSTVSNGGGPIGSINVSNANCGTGASYGQVCATNDPIVFDFASDFAYANQICATNQVTTRDTFNNLVLNGLVPNCVAPVQSLPQFNKAAHTATMTSASAPNCTAIGGCTITLNANTKYTGSIATGTTTNYIVTGDTYITGNIGTPAFGGGSTNMTFTVANSVTTRPIIMFNGRMGLTFGGVVANASGITPIFISFYSADSSISNSDTYSTQDPANVYNTLTSNTPAIQFNAPSVGLNCSLYAYFGAISLSGSATLHGTLAGQQVNLDNGGDQVTLTNDPWPN